MTPAEFKTRFPEFIAAPDPFLQTVLDEIEAETSDNWESVARRNTAVGLKTASRVARSPLGRNALLMIKGEPKTLYDEPLCKLYDAHACCLNRLADLEEEFIP